jgi:hypothetical protein
LYLVKKGIPPMNKSEIALDEVYTVLEKLRQQVLAFDLSYSQTNTLFQSVLDVEHAVENLEKYVRKD